MMFGIRVLLKKQGISPWAILDYFGQKNKDGQALVFSVIFGYFRDPSTRPRCVGLAQDKIKILLRGF